MLNFRILTCVCITFQQAHFTNVDDVRRRQELLPTAFGCNARHQQKYIRDTHDSISLKTIPDDLFFGR